MLQVMQNYKGGDLRVEEVPSPVLQPGGVLVKNHNSLISAGTEKSIINLAQSSIVSKAKQRPDLVKQVLEKVKQEGLINTFKKVMGKLDSPMSVGYSCAGEVVAVASDVKDLKVGDRVACAGAGYANHAEMVYSPRNLTAKIPEGVSYEEASFSTVASIALQGIRQAEPKLGENVAVIGLGLIGLLTAEILKANGCNVIGVDVSEFAVNNAKELGHQNSFIRDQENLKEKVNSLTNGFGADSVLITASADSNDPVEFAGEIARDRAKIVAVGMVGLDIPRNLYYEKELDLRLSRSYGPGRYDNNYEEKGNDYPIGYVRWTEQRNMQAFLKLLADQKIDLEKIITHKFKIENAKEAYDMILGNKESYLGVLLEYNTEKTLPAKIKVKEKSNGADKVNSAMVGAGNFAKGVLIPNLEKISEVNLNTIVTATGASAKNSAKKFGFSYCTTDEEQVYSDENINTVFITTRHNLHTDSVVKGLENNKNVYVEKPLGLYEEDLEKIIKVWNKSEGKLMVGFNRRFSPFTKELKEFYQNKNTPLVMNYTVNAGYIPGDHWTQDPEIGGGRIKGEVCHFLDLLSYIADSEPVSVYAQPISANTEHIFNDDNLQVSISFADGSVGNITYTALGDSSYPKERIEAFADSAAAILDNFNSLTTHRNNKSDTSKKFSQQKGFEEELNAFVKSIEDGTESPISFKSLIASSLATLKIVESMEKGVPVEVNTDQFINKSLGVTNEAQ